MKKKLVVVALSAATLFSGMAFGIDFDPKFYVGGEAQYGWYEGSKKGDLGNTSKTPLKGVNDKSLLTESHPGAGIFIGSRLHENFGVEAGASMALDEKIKKSKLSAGLQNSSLKARNYNFYADAIGHLPVAEGVELLASVGVGRLTTKVTGKVAGTGLRTEEKVSTESSKVGLRLGAGAQYKFDENLAVRLMIRHQKGNKFVKHVNSAGLGLFYQF